MHKIELTKYTLVIDILDEEVDPSREDADEDVEIKEKRHPCGRLMLRDGRNDWNVYLSVASVPERVEPPAPRSNDT